MLTIRAALLALGLGLAGVVNLFFAPQIYDPRPPVFSGPDMAANLEWRGHAFALQTWWLDENVPEARYAHVGPYLPENSPPDTQAIGILLDDRPARLLELEVDPTLPPFDVTELGIRDELFSFHKVSGNIRCQIDTEIERTSRCDYFAAWDGPIPNEKPMVFVGVLTRADGEDDEVALVEVSLLERVAGSPLTALPLMGEERG